MRLELFRTIAWLPSHGGILRICDAWLPEASMPMASMPSMLQDFTFAMAVCKLAKSWSILEFQSSPSLKNIVDILRKHCTEAKQINANQAETCRNRFSAFLSGDVCMLIWLLHCNICSLRGRIGISYTLKLGSLSQIILNSSLDIEMLLISRAKVCSVMEGSVLLDKWFSGMSVAWSTPTAKAYQMLPVTLQEQVAANVSLVNTTGGHIRSSLQTGPANDIQRNMLLCRICFTRVF